MGKRSKQLKNKMNGGRGHRRSKVKIDNREAHGPCYFEGCKRKAVRTFHCKTCEAMQLQGKREEKDVVRIPHCLTHLDDAITAIKHHAIAGHPLLNVPRAVLAGLKGEL
ncbi:MAG: hypothetical protein Q8S00_32560 [Deltaproteobacteria bacterium]|nr:hypothetical protein [Deltaproteobacteria bacterium]